MFLCQPCFEHRMKDGGVPEGNYFFAASSRGECEDCGEIADCLDIRSSQLPIPSPQFHCRISLTGFKPLAVWYYIQNRGYVGNCIIWWREGGHGYTCNLDEAWKVNEAKAQELCSSRDGKDVMWSVAEVNVLTQRHLTDESLRKLKTRVRIRALKEVQCVRAWKEGQSERC